MFYLLQLQDHGQTRQVPVAEATAAGLERALLATDRRVRSQFLAEAIAADPALAVWAAHEALRQGVPSPATAAEAADWLAGRVAEALAACLSQAEDGARKLQRLLPDESQAFAHIYAAVLARATAARTKLAAAERTEDAAYFAALVEAKDELVASWPVESRVEERLLPAFPPVTLPIADKTDWRDAPAELLAASLLTHEPGLEWRLPALVALVGEYERRLADFDQRLEQEKLESLKELAYGASHEINNPLANIAARAQTLLQDEIDPQRQRKLKAIHRQAMRAHEMIADLMLFARPPKLHLTTLDLGNVARQVAEELAELAAERQIELRCDASAGSVAIEGDETQLAVAIHALVTNSLEAVGAAGHVAVTVRPQTSEGHGWAEVVVSDDGPGISEEVRRHMFDPFYSGREAGRGLGFGLSKCWRIVTDHGGQVVVGQSARQGAELTILLPLAREHARS